MVDTKYRQEGEVKMYYRSSKRFARDCYKAENGKYFEIPVTKNKSPYGSKTNVPLELEYGKFMDFMGVYIEDGCTLGITGMICIIMGETDPCYDKVVSLIEELGFCVYRESTTISFHSTSLWGYLRALDKKVRK